nr:fibroblast growth factor [Spodoptera litura nucleopolyhedrovirus]
MRSPIAIVVVIAVACCWCMPAHGTRRQIQLFVKNQYIAVDGNGDVMGSRDRTASRTVFHRISVSHNLMLLVNSVSCRYVCINACGYVYTLAANGGAGGGVLSQDCVLHEHMTESYYNWYYRDDNQTRSFLALNKSGRTKRVRIRNDDPLHNHINSINIITSQWDGPAIVNRCVDKRNIMPSSGICEDDGVAGEDGRRKKNFYSIDEDDISIQLLASNNSSATTTKTTTTTMNLPAFVMRDECEMYN